MSVDTDVTGCILSMACTDSPSEHGDRTWRHIITTARSADRSTRSNPPEVLCVPAAGQFDHRDRYPQRSHAQGSARDVNGGASMLFIIGGIRSFKAFRAEMDRPGLGCHCGG